MEITLDLIFALITIFTIGMGVGGYFKEKKLEKNIEKDEDTYLVLEKISNLTYLTTGNGYYLTQRGINVYSP